MRPLTPVFLVSIASLFLQVNAQTTQRVVDIPTRSGVTQRMIVLTPANPKAAVVLLAGGHGGLQIFSGGSMKWGDGNFLVRTRQLFADQGLVVALIDSPSDRQSQPFLETFRQTPEHSADIKAVIKWLREDTRLPVWLIGTSRGTQSAAFVATDLEQVDGPDGVVLTSTILADDKSRPVPAMPLGKIRVPVLVVHHEQDGCVVCPIKEIPALMRSLSKSARTEAKVFKGGFSTGNACGGSAHHGFNGIEADVVQGIAEWVLVK